MNIVVLAIDSLRADHLGCYGYAHPTSPRIDRLAAESALVEKLICPAIPTHPSFTTFHTGQHPAVHGIVAHGTGQSPPAGTPLLAPCLLDAGYPTCAVDNLAFRPRHFARGFETIINPSERRGCGLMVSCEELNDPALRWLETRRPNEPFFLMIHYWDPHTPYLPPAHTDGQFYEGNERDPRNRSLEPLWAHPLGARWKESWFQMLGGEITDADFVRALYDREIRYVDEGVGQILDALERLGMAEDTLVLLYADHGESMTEHGILFDHHGLYETCLRVPCLVRLPGRVDAGRIDHVCEHQDLAPMLLEAAGIEPPENMDGRGLWGVLSGRDEPAPARTVLSCECTWQAKWSLRTDRYKVIVARGEDYYGSPPLELYDLEADPDERTNLAERDRALARELAGELEARLAERLRRAPAAVDPVAPENISMGKKAIEIGRSRRAAGAVAQPPSAVAVTAEGGCATEKTQEPVGSVKSQSAQSWGYSRQEEEAIQKHLEDLGYL